ncbi:MAG TPA: hypothetical protein VKU41_30185 [Polyangiaceae bacterium]|nr:hypothetical protein [Polyangiaceae bacterium]
MTTAAHDAYAHIHLARERQDAEMARAMRALAALGPDVLRVPQRTLDTLDRLAPCLPPAPAGLRA